MKHSKGIHHITAVAGDPKENVAFYTGILGMRMVKKTVNFDDPSVYHLYYGDEIGNPGSILTFFPWTHTRQGSPGAGQVVAVAFSVPTGSFEFWTSYLSDKNLDIATPFERFGKKVMGVQDPDGLHLELIEDPAAGETEGWSEGPVPAKMAIRGFHGATLAEEDFASTGEVLNDFLGFRHIETEDNRHLYQSDAPFGSRIEIIDKSDLRGRPGKGTVHHIAFRAKDKEEQLDIREQILDAGFFTTDVKDRQYFRSVYFHEPGGVLFEIATDPPGFTYDEPPDELGQTLKLPPWLEAQRQSIEQQLPEISSF